MAGDNLTLICTVSVVEHLISQHTVTLQWSRGSVGSGNGVMVGDTTHSGVMSRRTLTFSPLRTSHTALYTCQAEISIPSINLTRTSENATVLKVECK